MFPSLVIAATATEIDIFEDFVWVGGSLKRIDGSVL